MWRSILLRDRNARIPHKSFCSLELVDWIRRVTSAPTSVDYLIRNMPEDLLQVIDDHWGELHKFIQTHPRHFKLYEGTVTKVANQVPLETISLKRLLDTVVPPVGYVRVSHLSSYLHDVPEQKIIHLLSEATLAPTYSFISKDTVNYVACKTWFETYGQLFSPGDNKSISYCIHLAPYLDRVIPNHWIPVHVVEEALPPEAQNLIKAVGKVKALHVIPKETIEFAELSRNNYYVRRRATNVCKSKYPMYELDPEIILKLAFSLPTTAVPQHIVERELFPSVRHWLTKITKYRLEEIVRMYPEALKSGIVGTSVAFGSRIRESYPLLLRRSSTNTDDDEKEFLARLNHPTNQVLKETLLALVETPDPSVMRVTDYFARHKK